MTVFAKWKLVGLYWPPYTYVFLSCRFCFPFSPLSTHFFEVPLNAIFHVLDAQICVSHALLSTDKASWGYGCCPYVKEKMSKTMQSAFSDGVLKHWLLRHGTPIFIRDHTIRKIFLWQISKASSLAPSLSVRFQHTAAYKRVERTQELYIELHLNGSQLAKMKKYIPCMSLP